MALRSTASALWSRFVPAARTLPCTASSSVFNGRLFSADAKEGTENEPQAVAERDEHAPPLNLFGKPARYASALYSASSKAGVLDKVMEEFKTVIDATDANPAFKVFLEDPTMPTQKKIAGLTALCDGASMSDITKNFLCLVAENGRLKETKKIYGHMDEYMTAKSGQVRAIVTTAEPMTEEEFAQVAFMVHDMPYVNKDMVDGEAKLSIDTKIDTRILGGMTVAIGEKFYDFSLKSRVMDIQRVVAKPVDYTGAQKL
mmetsp:Transcript_27075/g.43351  ORF Transcript_27075/g.43351 Transcript_27075/m.43351 type:complete len:258 (+) Transcript_27075:37-810(+)